MPRVFHHPSTYPVVQLRVVQPVAEALILCQRNAPNLVACKRKLRAAANGDEVRHDGILAKDFLERLVVAVARVALLLQLAVILFVRLDFFGAPHLPGAAQVDVALFLEIGQLEVAEDRQAVVVGVVVVPLVALGMQEENVVGQIVVIVNEVAARS